MKKMKMALFLLVAILLGCWPNPDKLPWLGQENPFPPELVKKAADEIERVVRTGYMPERVDLSPAPEESLLSSLPALTELGCDSPGIIEAIRARQERFITIQEMKLYGCLGENRKGLVDNRKDCPKWKEDKEFRSELVLTILAENDDRWFLYEAIEKSTKHLKEIQAIFSEVHRELAMPGEWIELPEGEWVQKEASKGGKPLSLRQRNRFPPFNPLSQRNHGSKNCRGMIYHAQYDHDTLGLDKSRPCMLIPSPCGRG